jgi:hypothetical protein
MQTFELYSHSGSLHFQEGCQHRRFHLKGIAWFGCGAAPALIVHMLSVTSLCSAVLHSPDQHVCCAS